MAINPCLLYILQSDWSLLLLVNTHGSFHCKQGSLYCKQGMLLVNIQSSCYCQHGRNMIYNFLWYNYGCRTCRGINTTSLEIIPTCYHRNKGEVLTISTTILMVSERDICSWGGCTMEPLANTIKCPLLCLACVFSCSLGI